MTQSSHSTMPKRWQQQEEGGDDHWRDKHWKSGDWKRSPERSDRPFTDHGECETFVCAMRRWSKKHQTCCGKCQKRGPLWDATHHTMECQERQRSIKSGKPRERSEPRDQRPPGGNGGNGDQGGNGGNGDQGGNGGNNNAGNGWSSWSSSYTWRSNENDKVPWERQEGGGASWNERKSGGSAWKRGQSMEERLWEAAQKRRSEPVRGPRSRSHSPDIQIREVVSGAPQHYNRGREGMKERESIRAMVVTGRYTNSDRAKALIRLERKDRERQGSFRFTSRACRKCQGLHCLYVVDCVRQWWQLEWHCPSDRIYELHKARKIERGCDQIKRMFVSESRSCGYIDPVTGVRCGGMTHTTIQHVEFHAMWDEIGNFHFWIPAITQTSFDPDLNKYRCMKASSNYPKAVCMLLEHEHEDPPGLPPVHYSWAELLDDYEAGRWAATGTTIWELQKCFHYARVNEVATVHFEDYVECLKATGGYGQPNPTSGDWKTREAASSSWEPRASTPAPSGNRQRQEESPTIVIEEDQADVDQLDQSSANSAKNSSASTWWDTKDGVTSASHS